MSRPAARSVRLFEEVVLTSLFLSGLQVLFIVNGARDAGATPEGTVGANLLYGTLAIGVGIAPNLFLLSMLRQRRNWARLAFVLLSASAILASIENMQQTYSFAAVMVGPIVCALSFYSVYLLLCEETREWISDRGPA